MFNRITGSPRFTRHALMALAAVCTFTFATPHPAVAQFVADTMDKEAGRYGSLRAKNFAKRPNATDRDAFGRYIRDYEIPAMTQFDAVALADLGKNRYDFVRNYLWGADPQIQTLITPLVFSEMQKIVRGKYHPAVRYNAMLMIGLLDATYPDDRAGIPPKPLPAANEFLTKYVSAGVDTSRAPAPLLVGAIVGLERHAKALEGLPAGNQAATTSALMAVLNKDKFPHDISSSVAQWMKVIAARGLAATAQLGDANATHEAFLKMLGDEDTRLNTRARIAGLYTNLKPAYEAGPAIDERTAVRTLLQFASDVAADEKERAEKYEEKQLREGGATAGFRGMTGGDIEIPDEYQIRRLILRLRGVRTAINAVSPAVKDQQLSDLLQRVVSAVQPVIVRAEERNVLLLNLTDEVKIMADAVTATSASLGVEAAEAPPESDEEAAEAEMLEEAEATEEAAAAEPAEAA